MTQADLEHLRQTLVELRSELREQVASCIESSKPVILDQASVGRLSRMDAMQGREMALETGRRRQYRLQKIEGALRRIESDDYGICFVCGQEIGNQRLSTDPTCTRCVKCAGKE